MCTTISPSFIKVWWKNKNLLHRTHLIDGLSVRSRWIGPKSHTQTLLTVFWTIWSTLPLWTVLRYRHYGHITNLLPRPPGLCMSPSYKWDFYCKIYDIVCNILNTIHQNLDFFLYIFCNGFFMISQFCRHKLEEWWKCQWRIKW